MSHSYQNLVLAPDAAIDLQLHTVFSDGKWTATALLDYLVAEGFALAAITDHERADTQVELQALAQARNFPLITAVEMSSLWEGEFADFLCYGFELENNALDTLAKGVWSRQAENTRQVFNELSKQYPLQAAELDAILAQPSVDHVNQFVSLITKYHQGEKSVGRTLMDAGFIYMTTAPAEIVAAAHQSGAVCILAHAGRTDGFFCFEESSLDKLREVAAIDGIEAYYPLHSSEQTQHFLAYAAKHNLLVSSGSDSHSPARLPIKYRAELSRNLLERLGVRFA